MREPTPGKCPIWDTPASFDPGHGDWVQIDSSRAGGRYRMSRTAFTIVGSREVDLRIKLTDWIIEQRRLGVPVPEVNSEVIKVADVARHKSVFERADNLLRYLAQRSDILGAVTIFHAESNPNKETLANELLAWTSSRNLSEVVTLVEYCAEEGWIAHKATARPSGSNTTHEVMLKPRGYARLAELAGVSTNSTSAFVAMWFDPSVSTAYTDGIEKAIEDAGYEPVRIDQKQYITKVDDEIIAEIRRSRFVVADFTAEADKPRGGVYYEAGFAHGLNIPVIMTVRKDQIGSVHFDTRQFNHITWETPEDLRNQLSARISAVIGDGPLKKLSA